MLNAWKTNWPRGKGLKTWREEMFTGSTCCETGGDGVGVAKRKSLAGTSLEILCKEAREAHCFYRGGRFQGTKISCSKMHVVWLCSVVAMQCG